MQRRVLVSADTVAETCLVRRATVLAWFRRGWIPGYRAGRRPVLFDLGEVQKALATRALAATGEDAGPPIESNLPESGRLGVGEADRGGSRS